MSGSDSRVWWRGVQLDARSAAMMDQVVRLCPGIDIQPSNGSWSGYGPSAGTHAGAGAIDVKAAHLTPLERDEVVEAMRRVGWAAWLRTPYQSDWPWHIHGIAVQPGGETDRGSLAAAAHDQIIDYFEGRNGLANNGPDDGPRQWVGVTWETYQQGDDMPLTEEDLDRIAWRVWSFNAGTMGGQSAASRLVDLAQAVGDVPARVMNYPLTDAGQHFWTWVVDAKNGVQHLLDRKS